MAKSRDTLLQRVMIPTIIFPTLTIIVITAWQFPNSIGRHAATFTATFIACQLGLQFVIEIGDAIRTDNAFTKHEQVIRKGRNITSLLASLIVTLMEFKNPWFIQWTSSLFL